MNKNISFKLWLAVFIAGSLLVFGLIFGFGLGFLIQKSEADACRSIITNIQRAFAGGESETDEAMYAKFDQCGIDY